MTNNSSLKLLYPCVCVRYYGIFGENLKRNLNEIVYSSPYSVELWLELVFGEMYVHLDLIWLFFISLDSLIFLYRVVQDQIMAVGASVILSRSEKKMYGLVFSNFLK